MAQRKLGRGLGALVEIPPASDDGTARVHEALRDSLDASVLALSGRSVEDFFRAPEPAPNVVLQNVVLQNVVLQNVAPSAPSATPAPAPAPTEPATTMSPPDDDARGDQYLLFDPPAEAPSRVAEPAVPEPAVPGAAVPADAEIEPPEPVAVADPEPACAQEPAFEDVIFDDVLILEAAPEAPAEAPRPEAASPAAPVVARPAEEPPPAARFDDDVLFLDESVGGIVLPDVELE